MLTIEGMDTVLGNIEKHKKSFPQKVTYAMEAVFREMVNDAKTPGKYKGFKDQTGALKNSINSHVVYNDISQTVVGFIWAGQSYAIYVEYKEGHWVLSGTWNFNKDKLLSKIMKLAEEQK
jgi:hypothetical protein